MPNEPIHSGHFMTSDPHSEIVMEDEEDDDVEVDVVDVDESDDKPILEKRSLQERPHKTYHLEDERPVTFYKFGPKKTQTIAIDISLNKLNKCLKVAYMKMTTPKWKDFKGLKLQWKHRIRLNNVIWRAYYMEFKKPDKRKKTPHCYFAVPDEDTTHQKIEGTVLEGMYWKRRNEAVCAQYKRWRTYNRHAKKKKSCCKKPDSSNCGCEPNGVKMRPPQSRTPAETFEEFLDFDFDEEFFAESGSLFEGLNVPFLFPNPKEMGQGSNADIIQPCLMSLQPTLDEIMNDIDSETMEQSYQMQQPQSSSYGRANSSNSYNLNSMSRLSSPTTPTLENNGEGMMDYRQRQPTRQSSAIPTQGIMNAHLSQPLYSQAVYETRTTPSTSSLDSPVGSAISFDSKSARNGAAVTLANSFDYVPQFLANTGTNNVATTNVQSFALNGQNNPGFRITDQNNQLLAQQSWWMNNQQIYNLQDEKAIQMLRSPVPQAASAPVPQGFPTTMLLSLGQPNQQPATYPNQYSFNNAIKPQSAIPIQPQIPPQPTQLLSAAPLQSRSIGVQQRALSSPHNQFHNSSQSSHRRPPDLSHYLPQTGNFSSPSASLTSILTAAPRQNSASNAIIDGKDPQSRGGVAQQPNLWSPPAKPVPRSISLSVSDEQKITPNSLDVYDSDVKIRKVSPTLSVDYNTTNTTTRGYKRRNNRRQSVPSAPTPTAPSITSPPPKQSRTKKTRNQTASYPSTSQAPPALNAPTPFNFTESSPSTAMTELSDEGSDEKPNIDRASRYSGSCSEAADSTLHPEERKRLLHLNAEKNRREALKDGFEALTQAIPVIEETGIKVTNAVVLNRAAQHIRNLQQKVEICDRQIAEAEKKNEKLQKRVVIVQSSMPSNIQQSSSGSSSTMSGQMMQFFERYVRERSRVDHRFFVMASLLKPVVEAFADRINSGSSDKTSMRNGITGWADEQFKAGRLRPLASQTLIRIATETNYNIGVGESGSTALREYISREVNNMSQYSDSL